MVILLRVDLINLCSMTQSCDHRCLTKLLKAQRHKSNIVLRLLNSSPNSLAHAPNICSEGCIPESCDSGMAVVIKKLLSERRKGGLWRACSLFPPPSCRLEEHCFRSTTQSGPGSQTQLVCVATSARCPCIHCTQLSLYPLMTPEMLPGGQLKASWFHPFDSEINMNLMRRRKRVMFPLNSIKILFFLDS